MALRRALHEWGRHAGGALRLAAPGLSTIGEAAGRAGEREPQARLRLGSTPSHSTTPCCLDPCHAVHWRIHIQ